MFIAFEGMDGCGKSTQTELLVHHLRAMHKETVVIHEPFTTKLGQKIHSDCRPLCEHVSSRMLVYMAPMVEVYYKIILPALMEGKWVIADRWVPTAWVYASSQFKCDVSETNDLFNILRPLMGMLSPHTYLFLDSDQEVSQTRLNDRADGDEQIHTMYPGLQALYHEFAIKFNDYSLRNKHECDFIPPISRVCANQPAQAVWDEVKHNLFYSHGIVVRKPSHV